MSEALVKAALGAVIGAVTVANVSPNVGRANVKRTLTRMPESIPDSDIPLLVIRKSPTARHGIRAIATQSGGYHVYVLDWFLLLGISALPYPEQQAVTDPWGEPIARALLANRDLSGACFSALPMGETDMATYEAATLQLSGGEYFGLHGVLTVTELVD